MSIFSPLLKMVFTIAVLIATAVGLLFALNGTDHLRCVKDQENFYINNWYKNLPDRARDAAYVYCQRSNNVPQSLHKN